MLSHSFGRRSLASALSALAALQIISCSQHTKISEPSAKDQSLSTESEATKVTAEKSEELMKSTQTPIVPFKLSNGLEVYLIEKKAIPMATVLIAVRNGSFIETAENNGLAHLYEHMFFKANEKIPSQPEFLRTLDEMGIELGPNMNAYTSTESVRYFFTIQSQYLSRGLNFMADALITPKFLQEELEKERKVVIGEFDRYEASPTDVFFQRDLMKRLFKEHFVRKNVIGTRPVINNASQAQMHEIQHRYYIPNNSALFVVGEFNEKEVRDAIEKNFSRWERGPNPTEKYPVPEHPPLEKSESFYEFGAVQTVHLVDAFHGPKLTIHNKDSLVFDLVSVMLGYQSSPFQKELVHTNLSSGVSFFSWSQRYTSPLVFSLESTIENAQKAYEVLMSLISKMKAGGFFSEQDLKIAQTATEVSSAYDRESGQKYALNLASIWSSTGSLDYYTGFVDEIKKITIADIDRCLKDYLSRPSVLGVLLPEGSKPLQFLEDVKDKK